MADAAVATGASLLIWSSLPHISKISNGKFTKVYHFDSKAEVEIYIRGLPIKSVFYMAGFYMQNFQTMFRPKIVSLHIAGLVRAYQESGTFFVHLCLCTLLNGSLPNSIDSRLGGAYYRSNLLTFGRATMVHLSSTSHGRPTLASHSSTSPTPASSLHLPFLIRSSTMANDSPERPRITSPDRL